MVRPRSDGEVHGRRERRIDHPGRLGTVGGSDEFGSQATYTLVDADTIDAIFETLPFTRVP